MATSTLNWSRKLDWLTKPSSQRVAALASDLVADWENRRAGMGKFIGAPGKAMSVGGTREVWARLCMAIVELRPEWYSGDLAKVTMKVVYSGTPSDVPPGSRSGSRIRTTSWNW